MKIIGKTRTGYLVEATEEELGHCAGWSYPTQHAGYQKGYSGNNYVSGFPIGTVIEVTAAHTYLEMLHDAEKPVKAAAKFMRELAGMIEGCLPTTIVPPPAAEEAHKEP